MKLEWIDAVKKAWDRESPKPLASVSRVQLPSAARETWDQYEADARKDGLRATANRFAVDGKNVFAVWRPTAPTGRLVHLFDAAGHLVAHGETDAAGITSWIGRN
jgi:hypothetical protein